MWIGLLVVLFILPPIVWTLIKVFEMFRRDFPGTGLTHLYLFVYSILLSQSTRLGISLLHFSLFLIGIVCRLRTQLESEQSLSSSITDDLEFNRRRFEQRLHRQDRIRSAGSIAICCCRYAGRAARFSLRLAPPSRNAF